MSTLKTPTRGRGAVVVRWKKICTAFTSLCLGLSAASSLRADPGDVGPFPVGQVELLQPNGISGITDPSGATGPTYNVTLAWARIMYPATSAGTGTPVNGSRPRYPIAIFLHGRHLNCDNDGSGPGLTGTMSYTCPAANRVPSHEGYNYIMQRLASQGIISVSISAHDIQPDNGIWNYNARGRLVLKFLDKLSGWNNTNSDPFGGLFFGKLDMSKIGLSGHSRGGEGVVAAEQLNATWPTPYAIVAVNAIAPTDQNSSSYVPSRAPYFLLVGARDGDVATMDGFRTYDRAYPNGMSARKWKSVAWVHGANHNYFNTIWTPSSALGSANPWAGATDDGSGLTVSQSLTAAEQRATALQSVAAFFRHTLLGENFKEVFTGRTRPPSMPNAYVFWTYQDGTRKALDNFEQLPPSTTTNTLGGSTTGAGFTLFAERLLNNSASDYTAAGLTKDTRFFHDTLGLRLDWSATGTHTSNLPVGQRNVSAFSHLTLRAAKAVTGTPTTGSDIALRVNIRDAAGNTAATALSTASYDRIPHPYRRSGGWCASCQNQSLMNGVRIPLSAFVQSNPLIDLTNIASVTIQTQSTGQVGIDDIEFGN